jgi:hypothetical protein
MMAAAQARLAMIARIQGQRRDSGGARKSPMKKHKQEKGPPFKPAAPFHRTIHKIQIG